MNESVAYAPVTLLAATNLAAVARLAQYDVPRPWAADRADFLSKQNRSSPFSAAGGLGRRIRRMNWLDRPSEAGPIHRRRTRAM